MGGFADLFGARTIAIVEIALMRVTVLVCLILGSFEIPIGDGLTVAIKIDTGTGDKA